MSKECAYSFDDLFVAAHARSMNSEKCNGFTRQDQSRRNALVRQWAATAGWHTKDRLGSDGKTYIAFAPFAFDDLETFSHSAECENV